MGRMGQIVASVLDLKHCGMSHGSAPFTAETLHIICLWKSFSLVGTMTWWILVHADT